MSLATIIAHPTTTTSNVPAASVTDPDVDVTTTLKPVVVLLVIATKQAWLGGIWTV
jgi:hypothetical protein